MNTGHLSEQQIQDYALEGENNRQHVESCTLCRQKVEMYQLLFSEAVKPPVPMFDFDLTESIMKQLPQPEPTTPETYDWAYWIGAAALLSAGMLLYIFMVYLLPLFRELTPITLGVSVMALLTLFAVMGYDMLLKHNKQIKTLQFS